VENLRKPGLSPATLIDAGVAGGTRALYDAFPHAYLVLIEPVREFAEGIAKLLEGRDGEHIQAALGAGLGNAMLHFDPEVPAVSSMLLRTHGAPRSTEERPVPITTLDELWRRREWGPPFGLKLDVEGYEHEAIAGATELLSETQFVIAEVAVLERYEQGHTFAQFVSQMDSHGFALCDILDGARQANRELGYVDAMFRRALEGADADLR
jgi:FkbM family methyltransferase